MLKGKAGVITGAAGGIGSAVAKSWIENGAKVICADINLKKVADLCHTLSETYPGAAIPMRVDVSNKDDIKSLVSKCVDKFGAINLYYSNAAILPKKSTITEEQEGDVEKVMRINALAGYYAIKYASSEMLKQNSSQGLCSIILTGSIAAMRADQTPLSYTASKGALMSMVPRANDELQMSGIRVNAVVPGGVNTDMFWSVAKDLFNNGLELKNYDMARFPTIEPKEIANIVTFLASDISSAIKGQAIIADGGMSQSMGSQPYPTKMKKKVRSKL